MQTNQAAQKARLVWSLISFACPFCTVALAFTIGRIIANEEAAMLIFGVGGYLLLALALVASIGAFIRQEKLRWLTPLPVLLLMFLFGFGLPL